MRIGELSARSGASVRSLRYYEEQGLLTAGRDSAGRRRYPESAVARVALIRRGFAASLSSRVIADLLPLLEAACVPRSRALLDAERQRLEAQIAAMTQARTRLDEVIALVTDPTRKCDA
ncbi:MerR family transcriptional regulator [Actinoplanes philippinensis]|uniref:DNA-binding transcriptional regulator, MerR family n=1 Tax=Actinoplanes philippinensis TaxID=35752 RepID=A0A1I2EHB4_9ACTN|nr:MerR family transcriptional regulator [Actinoplanes philippinensis]GIE76996.1 MerR family transcriptional regulator [Actinoplanes philippinensis]SFE92129.1 DNA-binding transcriptional regulator, MerR family [Actinoplanes philippinensis]